jgi:hypothetical protein
VATDSEVSVSIPRRYQIFGDVVGPEGVLLSLVKIIEELLE